VRVGHALLGRGDLVVGRALRARRGLRLLAGAQLLLVLQLDDLQHRGQASERGREHADDGNGLRRAGGQRPGDPGGGLTRGGGDGDELGGEPGERGDQALGVLDDERDGQALELGVQAAQAAARLPPEMPSRSSARPKLVAVWLERFVRSSSPAIWRTSELIERATVVDERSRARASRSAVRAERSVARALRSKDAELRSIAEICWSKERVTRRFSSAIRRAPAACLRRLSTVLSILPTSSWLAWARSSRDWASRTYPSAALLDSVRSRRSSSAEARVWRACSRRAAAFWRRPRSWLR
jgi:hypothetical protein